MWIFDDRKSVLSAKFVRNRAEFAPRSVGNFSLIMFSLKGLARVEVHIVHDDVIMHMRVVYMDGKHILILVIKKCLAKLLPDMQSTFGCDFTGGEALNYVLAFTSTSPCADTLSDIFELF